MDDATIQALNRLEDGDWEGAHDMIKSEDSPLAAWLHAHLHRVEGDPDNATYWYERADRAPFEGTPEEERLALRTAAS